MPNSPSTSTSASPGWFLLRAFGYRNYRLFFFGQVVSLIGTWLTMTASNWLVYKLAEGEHPQSMPVYLGLVAFAGQIPLFLLTPIAGAWVDRWNHHRLLLVTQFLSMLQSFVFAWLVLAEKITIPQVIALNFFQGVVNAFDVPTRQSFVVEMIENRNDLSNAIALNSSMVHAARLIGPVVAGWLIYAVGNGYCFLLDGFSYVAVLAALLLMQVRPLELPKTHPHILQSLKEGIVYAAGFLPVSTLLLMVTITSLVTMSQSVLMPIFANEVLGGSELTYGLLLGATGVGALIGSLYLASRSTVLGLGRIIGGACLMQGIAVLCFSFSHSLWLSLPILAFSGCGMVVQMASCNTVLQTIVEDDKRGRVMSLFTMAFMGMAPFGSLLAGSIARYVGAPMTLRIFGILALFSGTLFILWLPRLRPLIRPIYIRKGILPEVAEGLQTAAELSETPPK